MDDATRERLDRKYRPHLFDKCFGCGEEGVRLKAHVCDPVRRQTFLNSFGPPPHALNEAMVKFLEEKLLACLMKHRIVVTSGQLRDLAETMEPFTHGGYAAAA